jgi:diguanylate cyclase (GGDEF)-like protein
MMPPPDSAMAPEAGSDQAFQAALDVYLAAIEDIAELLPSIYPEMGASYQEQLTALKERLVGQADTAALEQSRHQLHELLNSFAGRARRYSQALTAELNQTLAMVARNEDTRSVRSVGYVSHLIDFVDHMEEALVSMDAGRLAEQASELRKFAESIELDSRDDYAQLREKLDQFQHRLHEAELLASRDPLTAVANRREFDRQLASRIQAKHQFCVLLFDLNQFKNINDRLGHLCGDEVLKQVGARLGGQVRAGDVVCRWGGDEFVVLLDCDLDHAQTRSQQIAQWLTGMYRVHVEGTEMRVEISVAVGVGEYAAGETPEQLFQRVDESLYRHKHSPAAAG